MKKGIAILLQLLLVFVTPSAAFAQSAATITLNSAFTYQTINGWEATAQSGELGCDPIPINADPALAHCAEYDTYKNSLFDQLVNDLGVNRVRLEIYPGVENTIDYFARYVSNQIGERDWFHNYGISPVNDDSDPNHINTSRFFFSSVDNAINHNVLPMKQRLEAKGEKLWVNLNFVHFDPSNTGFYQYNNASEYAELMLATFQHMKTKYGFVPDSIEIALEPNNTISFDGTKMGNAIVSTAALLQANGFTPKYVVPSTSCIANTLDYFSAIKNVIGSTNVSKYIQEISYHRYCGSVDDGTLQSVGNTAKQYGIGASMLEWMGASYPELHKDLTLGNNIAWSQYTIAAPYAWSQGTDNGGAYFIQNSTSGPIEMGWRTKFLRQYFRFIRRGAVRINATTTNGTFDPVAFINSDGKTVVVVKAGGSGSFSVNGLPNGTYGISYTTNAQYNVNPADVNVTNGNIATSIPTAGAITIYAKTGGTAPSATPVPPTATAIPPTITPSCGLPGDLNCSGKVDTADLLILLGNFGKSGTGDINGSGKVDTADLLILLGNFGK